MHLTAFFCCFIGLMSQDDVEFLQIKSDFNQ